MVRELQIFLLTTDNIQSRSCNFFALVKMELMKLNLGIQIQRGLNKRRGSKYQKINKRGGLNKQGGFGV